MYERSTFRGLSATEFTALEFTKHPSFASLKKLTEMPSADEDIIEQTLKYRQEFKRWVESYSSAGDDSAYASDLAYDY